MARPPPDLAGLVVLILAAALSACLILAFADIAIRGLTLSAEGSDLISAVTGAIIGVIATYVGLRGRRD